MVILNYMGISYVGVSHLATFHSQTSSEYKSPVECRIAISCGTGVTIHRRDMFTCAALFLHFYITCMILYNYVADYISDFDSC